MLRTQVYLTAKEKKGLSILSQRTGRSQSQVIRDALDRHFLILQRHEVPNILERAKGMWANRKDLPDFRKIRAEFDRYE